MSNKQLIALIYFLGILITMLYFKPRYNPIIDFYCIGRSYIGIWVFAWCSHNKFPLSQGTIMHFVHIQKLISILKYKNQKIRWLCLQGWQIRRVSGYFFYSPMTSCLKIMTAWPWNKPYSSIKFHTVASSIINRFPVKVCLIPRYRSMKPCFETCSSNRCLSSCPTFGAEYFDGVSVNTSKDTSNKLRAD